MQDFSWGGMLKTKWRKGIGEGTLVKRWAKGRVGRKIQTSLARSLIGWRMVCVVEHVFGGLAVFIQILHRALFSGAWKVTMLLSRSIMWSDLFQKEPGWWEPAPGRPERRRWHGPGESGELWRLELTDTIQESEGRRKRWQWGWSESPDGDALSLVNGEKEGNLCGRGTQLMGGINAEFPFYFPARSMSFTTLPIHFDKCFILAQVFKGKTPIQRYVFEFSLRVYNVISKQKTVIVHFIFNLGSIMLPC